MTIEELLHFKPIPIGPDPVGPWIKIIDYLDKEKQIEIFIHVLEFNKTAIATQKTVLDAQTHLITRVIDILGATQKQGFLAKG